ncbi:MAG: hypothetical protein R3C99_17130 [Pirellulaceae bacterium]
MQHLVCVRRRASWLLFVGLLPLLIAGTSRAEELPPLLSLAEARRLAAQDTARYRLASASSAVDSANASSSARATASVRSDANRATASAAPVPQSSETPTSSETPAIIVRLSEDYLQSDMTRDIDRRTDVRQTVMGVTGVGEARTVGKATIELKANRDGSAFQVRVTGATVAHTVARSGPAVIHTRAASSFICIKPIFFSRETGFLTARPRVSINTEVRTTGICSTVGGLRGCIVRRVASRRTAAARPTVTAVARRNAEQRILQSVNEAVDEMLVKLNRRAALRRFALGMLGIEIGLQTQTTPEQLTVIFAADDAAARRVVPPPASRNLAPFEIAIHRSLTGGLIGETLDDAQSLRSLLMPLAILAPNAASSPNGRRNGSPPDLTAPSLESDFQVQMHKSWIVIQIGE